MKDKDVQNGFKRLGFKYQHFCGTNWWIECIKALISNH